MKQQMGLDCIKIITKKIDKQMTKEEFYLAAMEFHNKYPFPGHNPPLTTYQIKNFQQIKNEHRIKQKTVDKFGNIDPVYQDPKFDLVYEDHIQPMNFLEAAEMFKQTQKKLDAECPPLSAWKKREWPLTKAIERAERLPFKEE